jgi:hypothetical protein
MVRSTPVVAALVVLAAAGTWWSLTGRDPEARPDVSLADVPDMDSEAPTAVIDPRGSRPPPTIGERAEERKPAPGERRSDPDVGGAAPPLPEVATPSLRSRSSADTTSPPPAASLPAEPWRPAPPPLTLSFRDPGVFPIEAEAEARTNDRRPGTLSGSVVKPDGKPLVGAFVRLHARQALGEIREPTWSDLTSLPVLARARTRGDGTFGFLLVPDAEYVVTSGPEPTLSHAWRFATARKGRFSPVVLRPRWRAVVRVVDEDGAPVARAHVNVADVADPRERAPDRPQWNGSGPTHADGTCFVEGRAPGSRARVQVKPDRVLEHGEVDLASWVVADDTLVLPRLHEVSGRLTGAEGLHRWEVALWARRGEGPWERIQIPDDRLDFRLLRLPKGPVTLKAHRTDVLSFDAEARDVVVEAGAKDVQLPVDPGETLAVRVAGWSREGPTGMPAHAWKSGETLDYKRMHLAVSSDGSIRVRGVRRGTRYDVWVPRTGAAPMCALGRGLEVGTSEHVLQPVEIRTLDGRVTEIPDGHRGVNIQATCEGWTVDAVGVLVDGSFTFLLPPLAGPWTVRAATRRYTSPPRPVMENWEGSASAEAGARSVTVRLEKKEDTPPR